MKSSASELGLIHWMVIYPMDRAVLTFRVQNDSFILIFSAHLFISLEVFKSVGIA